ncbi:MAG: YIP1 family protein [Terrimicrobiaceae bacterium]|nr:YIP1 family protein [Terrimicrobiaceae bacterium]
MGMIFINRNRQSLGQFTEQEVADGLQSGRFLPDDLAWQEPMESWQPLSTFNNLPAASPAGSVAATAADSMVESVVESAGVEPAWEREGAFFARMFGTVRDVVTKPVAVFRDLKRDGGYGKPLTFYVLIGWITGAVGILYQAAVAMVNPAMVTGDAAGAASVSGPMLVGILIGTAVLLPVFLVIGAFVWSGIFHVALMVVGGAKGTFETTFRAITYATGATSVGQVLPLCGSYITMIASLVYSVIALKEAHKTDLWRPIVALLIVVLLCCGVIFGVGVLAGAGAAAAAGAAGNQ